MKNITINQKERSIELTKAFANKAKRFGTAEYADLQEARRDYPNYKVVVNTPTKRTNAFKGLTLNYMETYIKSHNDENGEKLKEFYELCGKDGNGNKSDSAIVATYGVIKSWFLNKYPEFNEYTNRRIVNKAA